MTSKTMKSLGAAICAAAGLAAIGFTVTPADAASKLCSAVSWGTGSQCIGGSGSLWVFSSGKGDGSGTSAKLGVSIDQGGYKATAYAYDVYGNYQSSCTVTDTTLNGDSSYDITGCGNAATYKIRVYW